MRISSEAMIILNGVRHDFLQSYRAKAGTYKNLILIILYMTTVDSPPSPLQSLVSTPTPSVTLYNTKPHGLPRRPWVNMSKFLFGIL